jgi:hypothetical protein
MSTELTKLNFYATRGEVQFTEFYGGQDIMLQVTQGLGTTLGLDEPGFILLTRCEAQCLVQRLLSWLARYAD